MAHKNAEAFPASDAQNLGGLTKREYAAIHILAGMVNGIRNENVLRSLPKEAVRLTDLLMDEL